MKISNHIQHIHDAKRAHITWVSHAYALKIGMPLKKEQVPMYATDCQFGHWYYGPGQSLNALEAFKNIEQPHMELHTTYMDMFNLLFKDDSKVEKKAGFWGKLFGKKSDVKEKSQQELEQIDQLYLKLKRHSEEVVKALEELEQIIKLQIKTQQDKRQNEYSEKLKIVS